MNVLASECSSGCESGWTPYLEQSFHSPNASNRNTEFVDAKGGFIGEHFEKKIGKEDDEEEDLSMVSDASSGPPNFHEDEAYTNDVNRCMYPPSKATSQAANSVGNRKKKKEHRSREKQDQLPSFLDDTASSPVIMNFSSKNEYTVANNQASMESVLDYSQGFSATQFRGRSAFQDHYGFLQSSHSGNQFQNNQLSGYNKVIKKIDGDEIRRFPSLQSPAAIADIGVEVAVRKMDLKEDLVPLCFVSKFSFYLSMPWETT